MHLVTTRRHLLNSFFQVGLSSHIELHGLVDLEDLQILVPIHEVSSLKVFKELISEDSVSIGERVIVVIHHMNGELVVFRIA